MINNLNIEKIKSLVRPIQPISNINENPKKKTPNEIGQEENNESKLNFEDIFQEELKKIK